MRILRLILTIIIVVQISALSARSPHLDRAEDLYKAGRWADTRYELLQARGDIDKFDKKSQERIDVLLALCSVKLGDNESELWLERFEQRYPRSIYNNKVKLSRAMLYTARCDYAKAQECFEDVNYEALTPSEREKLDVRLGYIYFIHGDYDRARPIFKRVSDSSELYDHALYYLSYINYISNDKSKAKEGFGLLSGSDTYGTLAPYYILQVEFQEGNYKYVIEKGSELMDGTSQSWKVDLARTIAEACFQEEEFARAMDLLVQFKKGGGEIGRDERYIMGFSLYRTARYKEAIDELKQVVGAEDTMTQNASYHLADSYLKVGDKRGAMQAFALASNGNYNEAIKEDALFNYGKLLYELSGSGFDATINILTRYINEYPNSSRNEEAKTILISAYYNSHHYDAAYKAIKEIKHPDADIRAALQKIAYFRGIEAYKAGDYKLAESCLKEAATINISPKYSSLSQFWRGEIAYRKGAYSQALDKYRSFLMLAPKSDPTYKLAQYNSGYTLLMQGEHDGALNCFKLFTELESQQTPLLTDAQNRVGDLLYEKRQFSSASQSYKSAAAASDDGAHYARYQLAIIDGIQDRPKDKIAALSKIIAGKRGDYLDDATFELGRTYMTQSEYNSAIKTLERFISSYPSSPKYAQALSSLGLSYLNTGDEARSISYYDKAITAAPQSAIAKDAMQGIREIYIAQGNAQGYFDYAEKRGMEGDLNTVARDSLTFASAQQLFLTAGKEAAAAKALNRYLEDYSNGYYTTDALFLVSDCYLKLGKRKEAIGSLTQLSNRSTNQYSEKVLDRLSQLTSQEGMHAEAAIAYRKLYDVAKGEAERASAMAGYAKSTIKIGDESTIMKMADDVLAHSRDAGAEAIFEAKYSKATILRERGERAEALALYQDLSTDPSSRRGAESCYYVIESLYRQGNLDEAEKGIFDFADTKTPQSYWLAKSFLLLGDIYLAKDDLFQAQATYQSILDGYSEKGDGIIEEATTKIEKLK